MSRTRAAFALSLFLWLIGIALASAACSKGHQAADVVLPVEVVRAAPARTMAADTARIEMSVKFSGLPKDLGSTFDSKAEGELDFANQRSHIKMGVAGLFDTEMIMDGLVFYMNMGGLLGDPSKPWIKADIAEWVDLSKVQGTGSASQGDPSQALQWLRGMSDDVKELGVERVRGVTTTHYRGTVDMRKAMEETNAVLRDSIPEPIRDAFDRQQEMFDDKQVVDVWIDGDGLARRMSYAMKFAGDLPQLSGVTIETSMEMFDFGKPVNITLPRPDEVQDFSALLKMLDLK